MIIDLVVRAIRHEHVDRSSIWKLLFWKRLIAVASDTTGRFVSLVDSLLGDRFTNQVSIRLMEHANSLDLESFEDPVFYDKMERARRQTTSRLGMLAGLGRDGAAAADASFFAFCGHFLFALAAAPAGGGHSSGLFWRDAVSPC